MSRIDLRKAIRNGVFLLDGAMGTQLFARGIAPGVCNDAINIESSEIVADIHRAYLQAGSDAIITNTFGANRYALARHGHADKVYVINRAGAELARQAAGEERYVLGDIGPTGDFLEPLGQLKACDVRAAFAEQARGLLDGGVDGFIIETMTALDELEVAIKAVESLESGLPVFASMAFDKAGSDYRTMMGVDVPTAVTKMIASGVDAVGFNCGTATLNEYVTLAHKYVSAARSTGIGVAVFAEPNAGKPELVDGAAVYRVTPEEFAAAAKQIHAAGVHILGGCCGTAPAFIAALAAALK
ncbi:MAG TPA: homocysteine S-methyltransferase family protein [Sedimentisphaerales bacterium]|nr:homocysteine S-methyltransferase family protein [Sedimentisphaerales bacterium]HRS12924.1 homocysteine S-methyltransferase family protein [Sedimentisphaerales bacterium]HRV49536.1 homocysteine S-methyltransferase family protein [Sedimentisphaerales bacterium]